MIRLNPIRNPRDYFVLGNQKGEAAASPGIATLYDAKSKRKWDEILAYGATGAFSRFIRVELCHFYFEMVLTSDLDFAAFDDFHKFVMQVPVRLPNRKNATGYYDISYPLLAPLGIKACGVEEVGQLTQDDSGIWRYKVSFVEWKGAPKLSLAKPVAAAAQQDPDPESAARVAAALADFEAAAKRKP